MATRRSFDCASGRHALRHGPAGRKPKILEYRVSMIRWYSSVMRKVEAYSTESRKPREAVGAPFFAADATKDKE